MPQHNLKALIRRLQQPVSRGDAAQLRQRNSSERHHSQVVDVKQEGGDVLEISGGLLALRVGGNDVVGPGFEHDGHDQKASKHDVGYYENALVRLYSNQALVSVQGKNLIWD